MGFIFYNSTKIGTESNTLSFSVVEKLDNGSSQTTANTKNNSIQKHTKQEDNLNHIVRKNAHAFEYLVLAVLLALTFITFNRPLRNNIINILFISLLYAVSDEYHQIFITGRGSSVTDVIIDFGGAVAGIIVVNIVVQIKRVFSKLNRSSSKKAYRYVEILKQK